MAGYIGSKTVNLSTTGADIAGDADVSGDLTVDTNTLHVDSTNNRVGIGTSSPSSIIHSLHPTSPKLTLERDSTSLADNNVIGEIAMAHKDSNDAGTAVRIIGRAEGTGGAAGLAFNTGLPSSTAERMRIDSSGDVIVKSGNKLQLNRSDDTRSMKIFTDNNAGTIQTTNDPIIIDAASGRIRFDIASSEKMRVDGGGNLLVGKTSSDINTVGVAIFGEGLLRSSRSNGSPLQLNRLSTDGTLIDLRKDNSTVGSIAAVGGDLAIGTGDIGLRFVDSSDSIQPINMSNLNRRDNAIDLGNGTYRFDDIFATNGTINTSDRNEKQDIAELSDAEQRVAVAAKGLMRKFRWRDAVAEKGDEARTHFGVIAQDLQAAFAAEGLDAGDYAMFISTTWWETQTEVPAVEAVAEVLDEDGNVVTEAVEAVDAYTRTDTYDTQEEAPEGATERTRLGVRYSELLAFIIGAL